MERKFLVAGIGEVLWDRLPHKDVLGGAPANVAYHLSQLGVESYVISAVGNDKMGNDILSILSSKGINLYVDSVSFPTGTVKVTLDGQGIPEFVITPDVAWDHIKLNEETIGLAKQLDAVTFGSLAQRSPVSRKSILKFLNLLPKSSYKVFDINLRQDFYTKRIIEESLSISNILKINDSELPVVAEMFGLLGDEVALCKRLMAKFGLDVLAYTCGTKGSYLFKGEEMSFMETPIVLVKDTIGAGDSFTSGLIVSLLNGRTLSECHSLAVKIAAYVCENEGAMPEYSKKVLQSICN